MVAPDARAGDVLSHGHLFGLKTDVKSNVHFVDEHLVVYPCGHSVVFLHVESRAQQVRQASLQVPLVAAQLVAHSKIVLWDAVTTAAGSM